MQIRLSERRADFVQHIVKGSKPVDAARNAGYADPDRDGHRLLHSPEVLAAIHAGVQELLVQNAPASLKVLIGIQSDEKAPARVRADIGVKLMQMAGHVTPSGKDGKPVKPISEMTQGELLEHIRTNEEAIQRAELELAGKAKDITPARVVPGNEPKVGQGAAKGVNYLD